MSNVHGSCSRTSRHLTKGRRVATITSSQTTIMHFLRKGRHQRRRRRIANAFKPIYYQYNVRSPQRPLGPLLPLLLVLYIIPVFISYEVSTTIVAGASYSGLRWCTRAEAEDVKRPIGHFDAEGTAPYGVRIYKPSRYGAIRFNFHHNLTAFWVYGLAAYI
ncbi:hypothetical protein CYLTODRAFT_56830 [Cylindrobasidium torrendii FP15055 ss-10]|uniref:Uncharacterized protein n=1 Tax=Cylindrobasidium torrendii FP15055 ss-10 TaxID=1314674 RepID=A0A0D7BPI5_9AGAR|nr:hypothetical protein CYLTODRAFT_56830 [Cylindrobasidium torrendii FP15055 ss-10]